MPSSTEKAIKDGRIGIYNDILIMTKFHDGLIEITRDLERARTPEDYAHIKAKIQNLLHTRKHPEDAAKDLQHKLPIMIELLENYLVELNRHFP